MKKEKLITRTITKTEAQVLCLDVVTCEPSTRMFTAMGEFETFDELLKTLKTEYETETFKLVAVKEAWTDELLYGVSEKDFIAIAQLLDPNTRKPI